MRAILVLSLLGALIALAIFEQAYISKTFDKLERETAAIILMVEETPDETDFDNIIKKRMEDLHKWWDKREHKMCIFIKHIDLSYISDAMIYAKNFIEFDNKEEAMAGLSRLEYLLGTYSKVYGLNGFNIL